MRPPHCRIKLIISTLSNNRDKKQKNDHFFLPKIKARELISCIALNLLSLFSKRETSLTRRRKSTIEEAQDNNAK